MIKIKFTIFFILIILSCSLVYSSGMAASPSIARYIYYGEDVIEGSFSAIPREEKNINIFASGGDLSQYVFFEDNKTSLEMHVKDAVPITYYLRLPKDIKPGKHDTAIIVQQYLTPEEMVESGGTAAFASVGFVISVRVPNEGKYLEAELKYEPAKINKGSIVYFNIDMLNLGTEELRNLGTDIIIRNPKQEIIDTRKTTKLESLGLGQTGQLRALWETKESSAGEYSAEAKIEYGGKFPVELKDIFRVGDINIEIINVSTELEEATAKIFIDLQSNWNDVIKNVYAEIIIVGGNQSIDMIKTSSVDMEPWGKETLTGFWERKDLEPGDYEIGIFVYYYDKQAQKQMKVNLNALAEKMAPEKEGNNQMLLVVIVVLLAVILLMNVFWFVLNRNKDKPKNKGKKKK